MWSKQTFALRNNVSPEENKMSPPKRKPKTQPVERREECHNCKLGERKRSRARNESKVSEQVKNESHDLNRKRASCTNPPRYIHKRSNKYQPTQREEPKELKQIEMSILTRSTKYGARVSKTKAERHTG
jgi:hypothetical protein